MCQRKAELEFYAIILKKRGFVLWYLSILKGVASIDFKKIAIIAGVIFVISLSYFIINSLADATEKVSELEANSLVLENVIVELSATLELEKKNLLVEQKSCEDRIKILSIIKNNDNEIERDRDIVYRIIESKTEDCSKEEELPSEHTENHEPRDTDIHPVVNNTIDALRGMR